MDVGVLLPGRYESSVGEFAERVERLGYSSFWTSELWGTDALVNLGVAATTTDRIELGTAIVNVFSRTPAALSMAAATVADLSAGRAVLGLGVSTPRAVEGIHGMGYDRPLRRTHETVELIRALTGGDDPVTYDGEILSVSNLPPLAAPVPIYNAALGPANRRLTGRFCDGWLPHNIPYPVLSEAFEAVVEGAESAGRDPAAIVVSPHLPAAVSTDVEVARGLLRGHVAYYVGSGAGYRRAVAMAFPDEAERIASAWSGGNRDRARSLVTDEMIDAIGIADTPANARERLAERAEMGVVDELRIVIPNGAPADVVDLTVEELAPASF